MIASGSTQQINTLTCHPCFNEKAHKSVGRIHLPVASRCNIQCAFCERNMCAAFSIQHPGWTEKLLSVEYAVDFIHSIMRSKQADDLFVVGIAGPGDPLANTQTFETLSLIHKDYPHLIKCMSTNGLLLEDKLEDILGVGVMALTVTINATNSNVGKSIYSWVKYRNKVYRGEGAAQLLITKQFRGIRKAVDAGMTIKINTVLIPGINDREMSNLARKAKNAGVELMNIMPLIPSGKMKNWPAPTCDELRKARLECETIIPQFYHCKQCRADIVYLP